MGTGVTIVMYHYVRPLKGARYPEIKGLSVEDFREQIAYIKRHYNVIGAEQLMDAAEGDGSLPPRSLLLTFDDGYADHFSWVLPVLSREKLPACFFPPAKCILLHRVLDVNKIHFVLASVPDKGELVERIFERMDRYRLEHALAPNAYYWKLTGRPSRFDPAEVIFVKRMLQRELPEELRKSITDDLFKRYVTGDEESFSRELYMGIEELAELRRNGCYVGSHGYEHHWLNALPRAKQEREIDLSLEFLQRIGSDTKRWIMCYPYGAYDDTLLSVLERRDCVLGLSTRVGVAELGTDHPLALPRLDTNDLPKRGAASPNEWTRQVLNR